MSEEVINSPERQARRVKVEQYVREILTTKYLGGMAVPLCQNWWGVVGRVIDFYNGKSKEEKKREEITMIWELKKKLTVDIQSRLQPQDKLTDSQLNEWLGEVTAVQFKAIVDAITESTLPLYPNSPDERYGNAVW